LHWDINALILISNKNTEKLNKNNKTGTEYIANATNTHKTQRRQTHNIAHEQINRQWKYKDNKYKTKSQSRNYHN